MSILFLPRIRIRRHPDKVCDRISDTILDAFLERESQARRS